MTAENQNLLDILDLNILVKPFSEALLSVKPQSFSKDRKKVQLVLYLEHQVVMRRIEDVDVGWSSVLGQILQTGDTFYVPIKLSIKGVTRENYGEGRDPKAAASDALKRAAMLFGVGRYLYDQEMVWVPYDESKDKYRKWTYADYGKTTTKVVNENGSQLAKISGATIHQSLISDKQAKRLFAIAKKRGFDVGDLKTIVYSIAKVRSSDEIPWTEYDNIVNWVERNTPKDVFLLEG